eukprot:2552346-Heterocapsa_arctica.AAC.1
MGTARGSEPEGPAQDQQPGQDSGGGWQTWALPRRRQEPQSDRRTGAGRESWDRNAGGGQEGDQVSEGATQWSHGAAQQGNEPPYWMQPRRAGALPPDQRTVPPQMVMPGIFEGPILPEETDDQGESARPPQG